MTNKKSAFNMAFYIFMFLWTACGIYIISSNPVILISDVFGFIRRADSLNIESIQQWVDGFYPLGYPLFLRSVTSFTGDYEVAGKLISFLSGILCLLVVRILGSSLFSPIVGVVASFFVGLNPIFLRYSTNSGTDMVAATCALTSILFLSKWNIAENPNKKLLFLSGATLGLGYLFRYTTIVIIPFYVLWFIAWPRKLGERLSPPKARAIDVFIILAGFIGIAMPQLIVSLIAKGNPIWNTQGRNVCFGVMGNNNWGLNWYSCRDYESVLAFLKQYPYESFKNFARNLLAVPSKLAPFTSLKIMAPFALSGIFLSLWVKDKSLVRHKSRILLLGSMCIYCIAVSIAFVNPRLLLLPSIVLSVYGAYGVMCAVPLTIQLDNWKFPLRLTSVALIFAILLRGGVPLVIKPLSDYDYKRALVSSAVNREAGANENTAAKVLSLSFDYYNLNSRLKRRYETKWFSEVGKYSSLQKIHSEMRSNGFTFLLFDERAPVNVSGLDENWPFKEREILQYFEPIWEYEDARLLKTR